MSRNHLAILAQAFRWFKGNLFRFTHLRVREPEEWEKAWPSLTPPGELLKKLIALLKGRYYLIVLPLVLEGLKAAATGGSMLVLHKLFQHLQTEHWEQTLGLMGIFIGLNLLQLLIEMGKNFLLTIARAGLMCDLRGQIFTKFLSFPLRVTQRLESGAIINHINQDVSMVVDLVTISLLSAANTLFTGISVGLVILWLNWKIGIFVFLIIGLFIPLAQLTRAMVGQYDKRLFSLHSQLLSILQQSLFAIKYLKAIGFEGRESERIRLVLEENRQLQLRAATLHRGVGPAMEFCYLLLICAGLLAGRYFSLATLELSLIAPLVYALLRLSKPCHEVMILLTGLEQYLQAAQRLFGILATPGEEKGLTGTIVPGPLTSIKITDLWFGYDTGRNILQGANLELKRGEMVALMGETGAGKSTICDLVLGLYYNYKGRILFNGTELRQLDLKSLRPSMGYVSQEPLLIRGTIRDNLLYGCYEVKGEDEILRALQQSQAWEFVRRLPHRLDSKLGERGVNLSGGERQRLCLARELLRRPELLVMDEATAALDLETEALILADLRNLKEHMIILLVSHRLSVGKFVDRQITLEQGRLIQSRFIV